MFYKSIFVILPLIALAQVKLSYSDAVRRAVNHGRKAIIAQEQRAVALEAYRSTRLSYRPIWSLSAGHKFGGEHTGHVNISNSFTSGASANIALDLAHNSDTAISLSQPLMRGYGQNALTLANADYTNKQSYLTWQANMQLIIKDVLNAYWQVVSAQKNVEVQSLAMISAKTLLKQYGIKVKMGSIPRSNLVDQKAQLARIQLEHLQQNTAAKQAEQLLKVLINVNSNKSLKLTGRLSLDAFGVMPNLEQAILKVKRNNIDINAARIVLASAKNDYQMAVNAAQPALNIAAEMHKDTGSSLSLSLDIPINDPSLKQQILASRSNLFQVTTNLNQVEQDSIQNARNLWQSLASKATENELLTQSLKTSKKLYNLAIMQYKYGKASSLDVVIRQKNLVSDQQALISNIISYLQDFISLKALQGELLELFGISVGHVYV